MPVHDMSVHKLPSHGLAQTWASLLGHTHSEAEVVDVVRYFVAGITPEELSRLPEHFRPGRFIDGQDVADFAISTTRYNLEPHAPGLEPGLEARIATFFASAAQRLAQLTAATEPEENRSA